MAVVMHELLTDEMLARFDERVQRKLNGAG